VTLQVMVDIETMSLQQNALVLSVAAVPFELCKALPQISKGQLWVLPTREQILMGRHVDAGTQRWWQQQSPEAREHFLQEVTSLDEFVLEFTGVVGGADQVWAHGTTFDITILESLFRDLGHNPPWQNYRVIRDVRTIAEFTPKREERPDSAITGLVEHDPRSDCVQQIWTVWEHWDANDR